MFVPEARYGLDTQVYPTGGIAGVMIQRPWHEDDVFYTRFAANITNRGDAGEHDDEAGSGTGFGFGYRKYETREHTGWIYGLRADIWNLSIDWRDDSPPRNDNTFVIVFQPTAEIGYAWKLGDGTWSMDLTANLGVERNLTEVGEDVGDGAIFLIGFTFLYNG